MEEGREEVGRRRGEEGGRRREEGREGTGKEWERRKEEKVEFVHK